jgi:NAD-dependent SIR2 family protein deacetylase
MKDVLRLLESQLKKVESDFQAFKSQHPDHPELAETEAFIKKMKTQIEQTQTMAEVVDVIADHDPIADPYASCYHCLQVFGLLEIHEYQDNGKTPVCPRCGIDAVIPGTVPKGDLMEMNIKMFATL